MKYRSQTQININVKKNITDEEVFRNLACRIITEMSFQDLKKIINFEKIDPFSEESKRIFRGCFDEKEEILASLDQVRIKMLREQKVVLYEAKLLFRD